MEIDVKEMEDAIKSATPVDTGLNTPAAPSAPDAPTPTPEPPTPPVPTPAQVDTKTPNPAPIPPADTKTVDQPGTPSPAPAAEEEHVVELESLFGGRYPSIEDIERDLSRIPELEAQLQEAQAKPKFASERAQMLFDWANKFESMGAQAFKQFLDVQDVGGRLDTLSDQQLRFEAFKLDPTYQGKGLSETELREIFNEEEVQKYGNAADADNPQTPAQINRAKIATADAKAKISKMHQDFNAAKPAAETPQDFAEQRHKLQQSAEQALSGFKGIQLPVVATGENGEKLESQFNFAVEKPEQLKAIIQATVNPQEMWERIMVDKGIVNVKDGSVDMRKFGDLVTRFLYADELVNQAYRQGHESGIAYKVKNARNAAPPTPTPAPPAEPAPKNDKEGLAEAAFKTVGQRQ